MDWYLTKKKEKQKRFLEPLKTTLKSSAICLESLRKPSEEMQTFLVKLKT